MRILMIAPSYQGAGNELNVHHEIWDITSLHEVTVLSGNVGARDIYTKTQTGRYDAIHLATHADGSGVMLPDGELLSPDDIVHVVKMAGARLVFFNACSTSFLADYAVARGVDYTIYTNRDIEDEIAWKFPVAFYKSLATQTRQDIVEAFTVANSGNGVYGISISPRLLLAWQSLLEELRQNTDDIVHLRLRLEQALFREKIIYVIVGLLAVASVVGWFL